MSETINSRVKRCRRLADLTQSEVAEKLGMKCSTYSQMERAGNITGKRITELATLFGVDPSYLLVGEEVSKNTDFAESLKAKESHAETLKSEPFYKHDDFANSFVPTNNEINIIKIIRNLPKSKRDEVLGYIEKAYKDTKK